MTTKELAKKFGVKVTAIHNRFHLNEHYRGYEPEFLGCWSNKRQYNWVRVPESKLAKMIGHKK